VIEQERWLAVSTRPHPSQAIRKAQSVRAAEFFTQEDIGQNLVVTILVCGYKNLTITQITAVKFPRISK